MAIASFGSTSYQIANVGSVRIKKGNPHPLAGLLVLAAITVGPVFAGPTVRFAGRIVARMAGINAKLAVENAARSPKRTSATASALLIGVSLVALLLVLATSAPTLLPIKAAA